MVDILKCPTIKTDDVGNIYFSKRLNCFSPKIKWQQITEQGRKILMTSLLTTQWIWNSPEFLPCSVWIYFWFWVDMGMGNRRAVGRNLEVGALGNRVMPDILLQYFIASTSVLEGGRSLSEFKPHGTLFSTWQKPETQDEKWTRVKRTIIRGKKRATANSKLPYFCDDKCRNFTIHCSAQQLLNAMMDHYQSAMTMKIAFTMTKYRWDSF